MEELRERLESLRRAYERLLQALRIDPKETEIAIDATIQRFEFTFELSWKTIRAFAKYLNSGECNSGRSCIKMAFRLGWIEGEETWLDFLEARNLTSHTYDQETAMKVYEIIRQNHRAFESLIGKLQEELESIEN